MVNVDLQKAYDSVEWPFVYHSLLELGFPYKFVKWIMVCLNTVSYTINVNGELTAPFDAKRGLRQGDPISPYLFVICMEYLNRCLIGLKFEQGFKFHPRCKRMQLVHVCFADDLLLFTRGDAQSVRELMKAFRKFTEASGLKANQTKSCIYFGGVNEDIKWEILRDTGMSEGKLPFEYLGVPLSSQKLSVAQCSPLIKKITARIDCWSSKLLSYAGRVQLIKAILFGVQMYWCQIFVIPQKVLKVIQTACRTFLWTGKSNVSKRALVAWEKICYPKHAGGLGLINVDVWNKAAICKLLWNVEQKKDKIWVKWIRGYYIKGGDIYEMALPKQCAWILRKILGARDYLKNLADGRRWLSQETFTIKDLYKKMIGEIQPVAWSKMMYQTCTPPKCIFICWLLLQGRMVTCDYLLKMGIQVDSICCFCKQHDETTNHLFFGCVFTGKVWEEVTRWCGLKRAQKEWDAEKDYMLTQCRTKSCKQSLYRCALTVVVYTIWKERNQRRMQSKDSDIDCVIHMCKSLVASCAQKDKKFLALLT